MEGERRQQEVREFKLYKCDGKLLKGFSLRNNNMSFGKKKKKKSSGAVWEMDWG